MAAESLSFPNLIAGNFPRQTNKITVASGADLSAGAILGKITAGAYTATVTATAENTGDGAAGDATSGADVKIGNYSLECVEAATNAGRFKVIDPDGNRLDDLTVGVEYDNDHLNITIADGDADFVVGDSFTIAVSQAAGSGKFALCDKTATDGSENPVAVLAEDADAASADVEAVVYETGCFNSGAVSLADGTAVADVKSALEARNIYLVSADNNVNV